jgi:uncharacterized Zn finger protein
MSRYYEEWPAYVPVAQRREQAAREVAKLRKKGQPVAPVIIEGRTIASTFWGKAWCQNLEAYRDFESRLPRGRTYVRNGSVLDLQIAPLTVSALVSGSSIYKVQVKVAATPEAHWRSMCRDCAGGIDSLVELLQGRFSKAVMERLCRQDKGLFPRSSEINFSCSCPDYASMCKHVAAVLYGVGARLDESPQLLFRLRAVDENGLLAHLDEATPLSMTGPATGKILETDDVSALFGLEMAEGSAPTAASETNPETSTGEPAPARKPRSRKGAPAAKPARKRADASAPARIAPVISAPDKPGPKGGARRPKVAKA